MALTYFDAASLSFGKREFTVGEFAARTGNPRAAKVLSELKHRGLVNRIGRGRYRCLGPEERPDLRFNDWERIRLILLSAPLPKAWSGSSAVELWTSGRYCVSPSAFIREFHLAVPVEHMDRWKAYLENHRISLNPDKRIGVRVHLIPKDKWGGNVEHSNEPVIPRDEVLKIIRNLPAIYAGAEELLDD